MGLAFNHSDPFLSDPFLSLTPFFPLTPELGANVPLPLTTPTLLFPLSPLANAKEPPGEERPLMIRRMTRGNCR